MKRTVTLITSLLPVLLSVEVLHAAGPVTAMFDVAGYGAVGDGTTLNTKAIQSAVNDCAAKGGGTVVIPAGTFISGSVELKSNITLCLSPGAVLRGSDKLEDYPPLAFRHNELGQTRSLLWAMNQSDIRITGEGTIDLNDGAFFDFSQYRTNLTLSSGVEFDERQRQETEASLARPRPTLPVFFHHCQRLRADGVTIRNAPCWTITFSVCRDIRVSHLTVANNLRTGNSDGLHFCGSKNATISDCIFSCGDDCIAITGITDWDEVAENFVIANCIMTSRSAALRLGHQASKVRNVAVNNLVIKDNNRGFAIFARDKGWVENVRIHNVVMETRLFAGGWWGKGEPLVLCAAGSGHIKDVSVANVRAESENGILVIGEKNNIRDVELRDWSLTLSYGHNRAWFKPQFELWPMPPVPAPDPKLHIPWLFAKESQGLRASNVCCVRHAQAPEFSIAPITTDVRDLRLVDCQSNSAEAGLIRELKPLSVRGVNYYPRETPWGGMWTKTPPEVFEKDMALAASLGCNTVRTFIQFGPHMEQAGLLEKDGTPTPAFLDKIEALLAAAWRHGIRFILCFDFNQQWLDARWQRGLMAIVAAHRNDGRVLLWDLMNEPDDDSKWTDATRAYLKAALPLIKQLDPQHLTTVGLTWRADRLREVGLPDVMQYHEYAGKDVFFKEGPARVLVTVGHQRNVGGARPLLIGEFGMSTARDERHGRAPELRDIMNAATGTEAEQARLYEIVLAGAEQGHAAGALAWCLHDYPIKNPNESHFGLVRSNGSLKPAALVLSKAYSAWKQP
jgi:hypothetical protein